ncbi:TPA: hypothetical protein PRP35_004385 [Escherichia coli]|uniref:hypothetical protein n=1 Tax=Escherichia coli TaxID=562 RepID=UPI000390E37B|nr:hypothetical protein [Escherichia coli]EFZ4677960.1 hypothetical protein [Shigella sonnei]EQO73447.1 hypothetical protein G720_05086 [Escherichia coli HVH 45 (4-3129918)]HDJ8384280.1 hypothetical protein [Escherichia coli]
MSEKWSKEFDSCFQVGSIEEIADALEKRSGSEENALAMLAMTAFTLMTRRGICEMQNDASLKKKGRNEVSLRNKAAAENLPPCCPLTFNFVG